MQFSIPPDHPSLPGHFPGRPIVPGVVLLDRVVALLEAELGTPAAGLRLAQAKFLQPLLPGELARVELARIEPQGAAPRWRFRILRGEVLLATGELGA